jgi:8-oxo-dGTP pyrophosphatase MutT (NUDIX family)
MEKIFRAGIIPFYVDQSTAYMLFMRPSDPKYGGVYFQIAKGKREDGETDLQAALREGFEELGLLSENIEEIIETGTYLGRTTIFLARIKNKENFTNFHFETEETRWLTVEEFKDYGRNLHLPVIKSIIKNHIINSNE